MNCKGFCQDDEDGEHLCNDQCLSLNQSCDGKCPREDDELDCAGICFDIRPSHKLCNDDCIPNEAPCNGECRSEDVFCNGECQSSDLQCNGECIDEYKTVANCDGTCYYNLETWICDSQCQKTEQPCNGECPPGNYLVLSKLLVFVKYEP